MSLIWKKGFEIFYKYDFLIQFFKERWRERERERERSCFLENISVRYPSKSVIVSFSLYLLLASFIMRRSLQSRQFQSQSEFHWVCKNGKLLFYSMFRAPGKISFISRTILAIIDTKRIQIFSHASLRREMSTDQREKQQQHQKHKRIIQINIVSDYFFSK